MTKKKQFLIIIVIVVLVGLAIFWHSYISWKKSCEYVNHELNCGTYDCGVEGYFSNHSLCRH